jgi:hypothetical protein
MADEIGLDVRSFGPDVQIVEQLGRTLVSHPRVEAMLSGARGRLLSLDYVEPDIKEARPSRPSRYRASIYDYTNNRTLLVDGLLGALDAVEVTESGIQPIPNDEEFSEAVQLVAQDEQLGPLLRERRLQPYPPMPPLIDEELLDGAGERVLAVGLMPPTTDDLRGHEIVGVNLGRQSVMRFDANAPARAAAHNPICGPPNAGQPTATKGAPGQVWITVSQGGTTLWRFLAVRPAASSGTNGSGVELRYVDYRGKRVLHRAHVPILNVKYDGNACGPYLDWQSQEGMIKAIGTDVAPGFRLCPSPATTILDTGDDTGNFLGVAIYVQGLEVVLVSEMQAGWYRYISQWRLHVDGTIRPRFGFSAVASSCVCTAHHHHPYWRFDFDLVTPGNNRVREFNNPPLVGSSNWHTKKYETQRARNPGRNRMWRIENSVSGEAYDVIPGHHDGVATASPDWPFPQGDVWITRYRGSEIDNGVLATGPPFEANIGTFVNGEPIENQDVVFWYGAHVTHDIAAEPPGIHGHTAGPDLKLVSW